jgi:hypothetical protein
MQANRLGLRCFEVVQSEDALPPLVYSERVVCEGGRKEHNGSKSWLFSGKRFNTKIMREIRSNFFPNRFQ